MRSPAPNLEAGGHRFDPGTLHGSAKPFFTEPTDGDTTLSAWLVRFGQMADYTNKRGRSRAAMSSVPRASSNSCA